MYLETLPVSLVRWFESLDEFNDCIFNTAYPAGFAYNPISEPTVVIGCSDIAVEYSGTQTSRNAETSFVVNIYVPLSSGGSAATVVAAKMLDALLFSSGLNLIGSKVDPVQYERNSNALRLDLTFTVYETIYQAYDYPPLFD